MKWEEPAVQETETNDREVFPIWAPDREWQTNSARSVYEFRLVPSAQW